MRGVGLWRREAGDAGRARGGCGGVAEEFRTSGLRRRAVVPGVEVGRGSRLQGLHFWVCELGFCGFAAGGLGAARFVGGGNVEVLGRVEGGVAG